MLVGQGALGAEDKVLAVAQKLDAPIIKALLGKAVTCCYCYCCSIWLLVLGRTAAGPLNQNIIASINKLQTEMALTTENRVRFPIS